jgi:uncharacterized protein (TIGR02452 family)
VTTATATRSSSDKKSSSKGATGSTSSKSASVVYISELPIGIDDNIELERQIRRRLEKLLKVDLGDIKCYAKLGVGSICVDNDEIKDQLINDFGRIALDPGVGNTMISFVAELELVSYIVLEITKGKKDDVLPTAEEVRRRWSELYKCEKPRICEQLNIQFPNIYKIVFTSLDEVLKTMHNQDFSIKGQFARIYHCADCSFLEDLPRSVTEDKLRQAISQEIHQPSISSSCMWIDVNKQASSACIIVTGTSRLWSSISHIRIDGKLLSKTNKLTCRLRIYPVPQSFAVHKITNHSSFGDTVASYKHHGENLILELKDKTVFDEYVTRKAFRVDDHNRFHVEAYSVSSNPETSEIDEDTWYDAEMPRHDADIMQYVANPEHEIFRYKWNSQIWLKQFKNTTVESHGDKNKRDRRDTPNDQTRHKLRVTVMLNTLGAVRQKGYVVNDRECKLEIDNKMKTIIYDQRSKLRRGEKLSFTKAPYPVTRVDVIREDCLVVYERLVKNGNNPLLLNMANATTPGGGYRKGDGAQEENIFRRSDYFRSLDVGLDQWLSQRSERFHCSSNCQLDPLSDHNDMYPMHEFGAIYTSGLTVFRQSEDDGYPFMTKPIGGVCSLAMAAYRDPKLDGNMLAPKFAVGTRKKIENIFAIAFHHKHDSIVLSAFGCGAFKNPPGHVAQLFSSVIEQYAGFFKLITFAIIDDHNSGHQLNPDGNFKPFKDILDGMMASPLSPINRPNTMFGPYRLLSNDVSTSDVCIFDKIPCNFGGTCKDMHNYKHSQEYSHPSLCPYAATKGNCDFMKDSVHMHSFIHRNRCQYAGECRQIDDQKHTREYEHPSYCPDGGDCHDMKAEHLKGYRHLPLCKDGHKCIDYQKHSGSHCKAFRHCALNCPYGNHCANFHDKKHQDMFEHPFPTPCLFTPFHCELYVNLMDIKVQQNPDTQQHCLNFAHVCRLGRDCTDKTSLHLEKSIHIARHYCPDGNKCKKLNNEDHLNSFTHPQIHDIREFCKYADECYNRRQIDHITKFRHAAKFEYDGILGYFNLNHNTNFVQNQKDSIARVTTYVQGQKWKPLPSGNVPQEITNWLRTVQPVHRCNPIIFESILLHGHVMSRKYMLNLKDPIFVANSVLQHSRVRRISGLQEKVVADHAKVFITALVRDHFHQRGFSPSAATDAATGGTAALLVATHDGSASYKTIIKTEEVYFSSLIKKDEVDAMRTTAIQIADASINLHTNPSGIGYDKDKDLGTDKTVFSILGPHLGHYYGDVFIVFKRGILHHPDTNFSIQAATSYVTGSAYHMRPWIGPDPGSHDEQIKLYHHSKLNASIPGYDYATALELIALTSHSFKLKTMDIDLNKIFERWVNVDSHTNIEAHLPQLIPISYIDHIYIPKNLHDLLSTASHKAINANFKHRITIVPHDGIAIQPMNPRGPTPSSKSREEYQNVVVKELIKQYHEQVKYPPSRPVQGASITIASTNFTDHYVLPLTITQAYDQYCSAKKHPPDQTTYIYWQVSGGDMILTLSNESIDSSQKQPNLRCLICYIAPKPSPIHTPYHEHYSYLNNSSPVKHHVLRESDKLAAKSNRFHVGCNTDDFMTFCLEIQRSTNTVTLSHAGPNSIYNHEKISCTFKKSELDLTKLNFVHVSAGSRTVPVRNLIICFEKQAELHPTFDETFKKAPSAARAHSPPDKKKGDVKSGDHKASKSDSDDEKKTPGFVDKVKHFFGGDDRPKVEPCRDNVNCLIQYSSHDASDHNAKYSHPCRFSELCKKKEPHLTHEPHHVSMCKNDQTCSRLDDPVHRAEYRHSDLADFLVPCRSKATCRDKTEEHRTKYSHGENVYRTKPSAGKGAR